MYDKYVDCKVIELCTQMRKKIFVNKECSELNPLCSSFFHGYI